MFAEPDKGVTLEEASDTIAATIRELASTGVPSQTLERIRSRMLQSETRKADLMLENYLRLAEQLNSGIEPLGTKEHLEHIEAVSLDQVNGLLRSLANPKRRSIAFIEPEGE